MLSKLLTLLTASKGAAVAAALVVSAATVTVGASSPEIQDTVRQAVQTVTGQPNDSAKGAKGDCANGQPIIVAQRNAATKLINASFQTHQKALEELRGKGVDNKAAGDIIKTADDQLKEVRTKALNDVAALTLGREGQNKPSGSASPKPSTSPAPSASPCPSEAPEASEAPKQSGSPKAEGSAKPSEQGRVAVADRTVLDANIKSIVDKAVADMDKLVKDAQATVGALPSPERGKPSDKPGGKPSDQPGGKPSDQPGGKPSDLPGGGKPSESPKR